MSDKTLAILARVGVWGGLLAVLYLLRSFFLLIFLTFVFAYIQSQGVERLVKYIKNRTMRVIVVALLLLGVIIGLGDFLIPRVHEQGKLFVERYPVYLQTLDQELLRLADVYPFVERAVPRLSEYIDSTRAGVPWSVENSVSGDLIPALLGFGGAEPGAVTTLDGLKQGIAQILASASAFLLSLLFSFLIVLDLPKLTRDVQSLKATKLRWIYEEMAESLCAFGATLGKAFEAQMSIAFINTILTAIGIMFLGIGEKTAFLSVIVFLCSFIPVAGVFISSVPICLLALQAGGVHMMLLAILLITVIHMIEAYILNPKIYGHHLHMNPVIVLIILTIAGKIFHVWGLVLGVPICTYIFGNAIRNKKVAAVDVRIDP